MAQGLQAHKMHRMRELSDQGHPRNNNILAKSEMMDAELRPSRHGKRVAKVNLNGDSSSKNQYSGKKKSEKMML